MKISTRFYYHEDFYKATYVTMMGDYCFPYSMDKSIYGNIEKPKIQIFIRYLLEAKFDVSSGISPSGTLSTTHNITWSWFACQAPH